MNFLKIFLLVVNIISFIFSMIFAAFGIYEQITSPGALERLLKKLQIPLSYNQFIIVGFICVLIMGATYAIRERFFSS
ncbi:MAG: hypothetical protein LBM93_06515 [Oscillospiraceae bacterium]|jgi:hypothetical protein|nr:hypothetical protein [Oscillospiraceae bacterium]